MFYMVCSQHLKRTSSIVASDIKLIFSRSSAVAWKSCMSTHSSFGDKNIVLMGPPGAGKTTVGKIVGQKLGTCFIDVDDDVLEATWNMSVAEKLKSVGNEQFLEEEGRALLNLSVSGSVVSLTGSNPMNAASMQHVKKNGILVYLDVPTQSVIDRLEMMKVDRIVGQGPGISMRDILQYRKQFYKKWYDIRVLCENGIPPEAVADKVLCAVKRFQDSDSECFISTRSRRHNGKGEGKGSTKFFSDVIVEGLAADGGLFVPEMGLPQLTAGEWQHLLGATYDERAQTILEKCIHPHDVPASKLWEIIQMAYGQNFDCSKIAPVRHLVGSQFLLELFHGPTASFKDLALQLMPHLFAYCIPQSCNYLILVATSGDTGSAVLDGFNRLKETEKQRIALITFFPQDGISHIQKSQMIGYQGSNTKVVGVRSDFDFCQAAIKQIFTNPNYTGFLTVEYGTALSAANSINWARLLPQVVYHASAYLDLVEKNVISFGFPVDVCVPTGNFGNILAAKYAKMMGIPIRKLICASNQNNILTEFVKTGLYNLKGRQLMSSLSPAVDILKSSNLERYLHLIANGDGQLVSQLFSSLEKQSCFQLSKELLDKLQQELVADWCSEEECLQTIYSVFNTTGYILDPHTAVAKAVADRLQDKTCPVIISSTAHYAKFAPAVLQALRIGEIKQTPLSQLHLLNSYNPLPPVHRGLLEMVKKNEKQNYQVCAADVNILMDHVEALAQNHFTKVF